MIHDFKQNIETVRERNQYANEYIIEAIGENSSDYRPWTVYTFEWRDSTQKQVLEPKSNLAYKEYDNIENDAGYRYGPVPSEPELFELVLKHVRKNLGYNDAVIRRNDEFFGGTGQALPAERAKLDEWNGDFEHGSIAARRDNTGILTIYKARDSIKLDGIKSTKIRFLSLISERIPPFHDGRESEPACGSGA